MGLTVPPKLPRFHPATRIRSLGEGEPDFTITDALCHLGALGATGGGKTTGTGEFFGKGYLGSAVEMGMVILCAKLTEKDQWIKWADETGRGKDVRVFDASGDGFRFNFLDWMSGFAAEGGGLTINVVALLEEIITALEPERGTGGGDSLFWEDALHQLLVADVQLVQLAGYELSLPTLRLPPPCPSTPTKSVSQNRQTALDRSFSRLDQRLHPENRQNTAARPVWAPSPCRV
jgi:hypothetical protein